MKEAAKAVDEGKELVAKIQSVPAIPILEGTLKGMEAILERCEPIKK